VAGHAGDGGSPVALVKRWTAFTVTCVPGLCVIVVPGLYARGRIVGYLNSVITLII
jgi:hypothetical protein